MPCPLSAASPPGAPTVDPALAFHRRVETMCLDRLRESLNPTTHLFDRQLRHGRWERASGTEDLTSTAICLIGLHRAAVEPRRIALEPHRSLAALVEIWRERSYPGALGLLVWANAVWDGLPLDRLLDAVGVSPGLVAAAGEPLTTMENAWLVSGLAHEWRRSGHPWTRVALEAAVDELLSRQDPATRLFLHASAKAPLTHRVRRFVANFADQIYAVQAAAFAAPHVRPEALGAASACADRLVALQGGLGQWWWHYDPRDGRVARRFPVFSVHQDAMAPMALTALAAAGGRDHRAARDRGYRWIEVNEVRTSLVDARVGTIWRCVERREPGVTRLVRDAARIAGWKGREDGSTRRLAVNLETRPYEWGWCLAAGAMAAGTSPRGHAA
jgi:hypothetical protein